MYQCRNPSVIERKLKSELNLKRITVEAVGTNSEKLAELSLLEHFNTVNDIIEQIIEMDMFEHDKSLMLEREKTRQEEQKTQQEREKTQQARQLTSQLRIELKLQKSGKCSSATVPKRDDSVSKQQRTIQSYFSVNNNL